MEEDNQKLFDALNRNKNNGYDSPPPDFKKKSNYQEEYQHAKPPMKPKK
jgi:hypothetical protein